MAKIKSNVNQSLKVLQATVKTGLQSSLNIQATQTLETLKIAVTGPGRQARKAAMGGNPGHPGSGVDVPFDRLDSNVIGDITGELRNRLKAAVVVKRDKVVAEVGFGKEIRSKPGAAGSAINLTTQGTPDINVVPLEDPRLYPKDSSNYVPDKRPEEYIPDVILGTKKLVGRNVLRLALYDDIMNNRSYDQIKFDLQEAIKSLGVPF